MISGKATVPAIVKVKPEQKYQCPQDAYHTQEAFQGSSGCRVDWHSHTPSLEDCTLCTCEAPESDLNPMISTDTEPSFI